MASLKFSLLHQVFCQSYRSLVSHTFGFVYMQECGYCILFGVCQNEGNRCEATKIILSVTPLVLFRCKSVGIVFYSEYVRTKEIAVKPLR